MKKPTLDRLQRTIEGDYIAYLIPPNSFITSVRFLSMKDGNTSTTACIKTLRAAGIRCPRAAYGGEVKA